MLGSRGRGSITMRVCFGYFASAGGSGQGVSPVAQADGHWHRRLQSSAAIR